MKYKKSLKKMKFPSYFTHAIVVVVVVFLKTARVCVALGNKVK